MQLSWTDWAQFCSNSAMEFREQSLGKTVRFLLPSLKLKQPGRKGRIAEEDVHQFLIANFGGYTALAANYFGYWKDEGGRDTYGEHREFTVALTSDEKLPQLKGFLADVSDTLGEECLYVEVAGEAFLIYPRQVVK
jgi:hypothetical protein